MLIIIIRIKILMSTILENIILRAGNFINYLRGNSNSTGYIDKNNYNDIINKLDTMDVLLFNGQDYWFSYIVEAMTDSKFSHIGLVLKSPTYIDPSLTGIYFLESGSEIIPDAEDGKIKFGVQITELSSVIQNYTGRVYYRKLQLSPNDSASPITNNSTQYDPQIANAYQSVYDAPYDDNVIDLFKAVLGINLGDNQRTDDFFCSAVVTYIYTKLGIFPTDIQWDLIEPKDYTPNGKIDQLLKSSVQDNSSLALGTMVKIK
jgi:hypothetical protein